MRPDGGSESFRPIPLEHVHDVGGDAFDGPAGIHGDDWPALGVSALPRRVGETVERGGHPPVKLVIGRFDSVATPAAVGSSQRGFDGQTQQHREIGDESARGEVIRRHHASLVQPATSDLVRISGQEETIGDDVEPGRERRSNASVHELGTRRHEQKRLRACGKLRTRLEEEPPDLVADGRPPGLANGDMPHAPRGKRLAETANLRRLPDAFRPLENDQLPARRVHPNVMMELVAPFRIPSVIQLLTWTIVLSKFSWAAIARW